MKFAMLFNEYPKEEFESIIKEMKGKPFYGEDGKVVGYITSVYSVGSDDMNIAEIHVKLNELGMGRYPQ